MTVVLLQTSCHTIPLLRIGSIRREPVLNMTATVLLSLEMSMPIEFVCIPPICESRPESIFSHCRFNLLGDTNSKAQPAQIERCNKGMADRLNCGHRSPRRQRSANCSPYCSLGMRWKESWTGCPTFLPKFIVIGGKAITTSSPKQPEKLLRIFLCILRRSF